MLETLYLTLKCIQIQGNNLIREMQVSPLLDDDEKTLVNSFRSEPAEKIVNRFKKRSSIVYKDLNIIDICFNANEETYLEELC